MQLVDGFPLCHVTAIDEPGTLFARLMAILVQFAEHGLIHGDFNEFNLMVSPVSKHACSKVVEQHTHLFSGG